MMRSGLVLLLLSAATATTMPGDEAPAMKASGAAVGPTPAIVALQNDVERYISATGWSGSQWSVTVLSLDKGDTLVSHSPDLALAPASNMKLFTSAAALYYLGPQYRYSTFLLTAGKTENGVLDGDLILYGTGDPTLSDRFGQKLRVWNTFADTLTALGIREIRGRILADASYFVGSGAAQGWETDYITASYAAPASAISYAENIATLNIKPTAVGQPPEVKLVPGGEGIAIVNEARTVQRARSWIHVTRTTYDGPVIVRGQIGKNSVGVIRTIPVADPPKYAAAALRETLAKRGIVTTGGVDAVTSADASPVTGRMIFAPAYSDQPPLRVLAIHQSPPLVDILEVVNKKSHNLLAEQTLRTVGRVAVGEGSVEGGVKAVKHLLAAETGGASADLAIYDGSGLSTLNRVTSRSITHLLSFMAKSPMYTDYFETLPQSGARDGLHRMYRTGAEGNLRAKTGTIDNVSALSGYVRAANGERLAFSIISNRVPSTWRAKRVEDAIGARLAAFNRDGEVITVDLDDEARPAPAAKAKAKAKPASSGRTYTIKRGDTLSGIARKHGITVTQLQRANAGTILSEKRLIPGKKIKLP
jgi:serine-type D-Ala-D-Ala carboxypeptidase/endopeptidase (penicillin-binding protein 4)